MKPTEWIERLQTMNPEESICMNYWQVGDVTGKADEMGVDITNEDAQEILDEIEDNIDSDHGVSWTTLRVYIEDFIEAKKKK
jgi:hypothetical protein